MLHAARHSAADSTAFDVIIIGAGPIGLACGIEAKRRGFRYLIIEKGCVVNSIYHYPIYMRFFSTANLLEIGEVPFITHGDKPTRQEALSYYRLVANGLSLNMRLYEEVVSVKGQDGAFQIETTRGHYTARKVIAAIGFSHRPRMLNVPGEKLDKVSHYFREPHPYSGQRLLVVGSGNSAVEAALDCFRHGAKVTLVVRGENLHEGIKYWIRPDIENRIKKGEIAAYFNTRVLAIKPDSVLLDVPDSGSVEVPNDFVLALTGYEPNFDLLEQMGVAIGDDEFRTPSHDPQTYETNRAGLYLAGVVVGGLQSNRWFIENSRIHARYIFDDIEKRRGRRTG
ncbi:YpdA family putative bacillithiol disulfide reductase [bacterium]|nr:YpdA family putative bacillithiol disulfide reductase [bacterium]